MRLNRQRFYQYFTVFFTFGLLVFPTVIWFSIYSKFDYSVFSRIKDLDSFPILENYYNKNFPFRKQIILAYHGFTSKVRFRATTHIPGNQQNWAFLKRTYSGFIGKNRFSDNEKKTILHNLEKIDLFLKKRNIKFIVMLTPDKIQIYPEFLPWIMRKKQTQNNACEDLIRFINDRSDITICYPKNELLRNKKSGLLYYPNDSHWNMKGAYMAFLQIANKMDKEISFPQPDAVHWIQKEVRFGDLGLVFPYKMPFPSGIRHTTTNDAQRTFNSDRKDQKVITPNAPSKLKIMVFHDSFFVSMEPYFHHYFQSTHQLARFMDYELIEKEKPDVVFFQIVERNVSSFLNLVPPTHK